MLLNSTAALANIIVAFKLFEYEVEPCLIRYDTMDGALGGHYTVWEVVHWLVLFVHPIVFSKLVAIRDHMLRVGIGVGV